MSSASNNKNRPLPKFGDWDVNNPASGEGFTVIFNKARDQKKTNGTSTATTTPSPSQTVDHKNNNNNKKNQAKKWLCCFGN